MSSVLVTGCSSGFGTLIARSTGGPDAVMRIADLSAGQRPLRAVVGPVFTEGVAEFNQTYEQLRAHMEQVLRRPDQAITWTRRA